MNQYRSSIDGSTVEAVECWRVLAWARYDWDKVPAWLRSLYETSAVIFMPDALTLPSGKSIVRADRHDWITYDPKDNFVEVYTPEGFSAFQKVPV